MYYDYLVLITWLCLAVLLYIMYRNRKLLANMKIHARQQQKEIQLMHMLLLDEEKERLQINKKLHDGVSGMVAAVKMYFSSISSSEGCLEQQEEYQQGMRLLNEIALEVRKTSHCLTPEGILENGLDEALFRYCTKLNHAHNSYVQYDSWGAIGRFTESFELSVYRVIQELTQFMIQQCGYQHIAVQMTLQEHYLSITIEACQPNQKEYDLYALLPSLETRVQELSGKIEMDSNPESSLEVYLGFETEGLTKLMTECDETNQPGYYR